MRSLHRRHAAAELWTHAINGLSEADFIMAAKIDRVASAALASSP